MSLTTAILRKNGLPIIGIVLLLLVNTFSSFGQKKVNPFEILPKLKEEIAIEPDSQESTNDTSSNPFEIKKASSTQLERQEEQIILEPTNIEKQKELSTKVQTEDTEAYKQFLFITILVMMIVLTLLFTIFRIIISKSYRAFLNDNILSQLHREQGSFASLPYLILYLLFFFVAGMFLFLLVNYYEIQLSPSHSIALTYCVGSIFGVFMLKHTLLKVTGFIFPLSKEMGLYSFTIIIFNIIISLGLIPFIIFIAFAPSSFTGYLIYIALGLLFITIAFRNLRGLFIGNRFLAFHKFHFLLYICAVEIAPLLIISKILISRGIVQTGMG